MSENKQVEFLPKYQSITVQRDKIADIVYTSYVPACHIKRVTKGYYLKGRYDNEGTFITTGELFAVATKGEPMRNRRSLKKIFRDLRQLISHNCIGGAQELFITLTYADQTNDPEKIHRDFKGFWGRLKYYFPTYGLEYISVVEPHASGNFHIHVILQARCIDHLYIPNTVMEDIWGLGFTKTERLEDIDNIGAYVIAYMSDMEIPDEYAEEYELEGDIVEKDGKKYIKGLRLDFYPDGMQIARHSRGMTRPTRLTGDSAAEKIDTIKSSGDTVFSTTKELKSTDDNGIEHTGYITTEQIKYELPWD